MTQMSKKEELTALAISLMQCTGFGALGLRRLAEEANMQPASLYNHFKSKNDMARQAVMFYTQRQEREMTALDVSGSGGSQIGLFLKMVETTFAAQGRLCLGLILTVERHALSPDVVAELERFVAMSTAWLAAAWDLGRADGSIHSALTGTTAGPLLFTAMEGILTFCQMQPAPADAFRRQADALMAGLGVAGSAG